MVKDGKRKFFKMWFRKRKLMLQQTIVLNHKHIKRVNNKNLRVFPIIWGNNVIGSFSEDFPEINHDCRLIRTQTKKYYLVIPVDVPVKLKYFNNNNAVALDPGVRIFQTTYDTNGESYK